MNPNHFIKATVWCSLIASLFLAPRASAAPPSFGERLGWKADQVVVILHVDDVGMSRSSNLGATESIEQGVATSWAVMMPCSWVPDIAHYLKKHPEVDSGLHLTLTSEWEAYRWGPLAGKTQVPGLVDPEGCLWRNIAGVVTKGSPDEVEREIRAQIDRAETIGLPITHLDSHMGTLFARPEFFERFVRVGIEKQIPILAIGGHATYTRIENPEAVGKVQEIIPKIWNAGLPVLDDLHTGTYGWKAGEKTTRLLALLAELKPGITEILFHASRPTEDFPVITGSSESRFADLKALTDPAVKKLIQDKGIVLTTWKELMARRKKAAPMPEK
ncbi:MAG: ChbG/HpnK family deacetylase [Verrucomicrobia bacterium]|nr:MAG: ChbG/HpnK family deacetylase [Verrucomicrobiota bacterium]